MIEPNIITTLSCITAMILLDKFAFTHDKKQIESAVKEITNETENTIPRKTWSSAERLESIEQKNESLFNSTIFKQSHLHTAKLLKEKQGKENESNKDSIERLDHDFTYFESISFFFASERFLDTDFQFERTSDSTYKLYIHPYTFRVGTTSNGITFQIDSHANGQVDTIFSHSSYLDGKVIMNSKIPSKFDDEIAKMLERVHTEFSPVNMPIYTKYSMNKEGNHYPSVSEPKEFRIYNWQYQEEYLSDILASFVKEKRLFNRLSDCLYQVTWMPFTFTVRLTQSTIQLEISWVNSKDISEELFKHEYHVIKKRGRISLDKLPLAFHDTLGLIAYTVETFSPLVAALELTSVTVQKSLKKMPNDALLKLFEDFKQKSPSITKHMEQEKQPTVTVLPSKLQTLCKEIQTLALSIEVNDGFDYLPIDIKHRFETLGNDYDKLIDSFHATSEASMKQKEETVAIGLGVILDKFQEIYTLIGELEHKDFLRQVRTIEQR